MLNYAIAVPSSSTICPEIASRLTPSIVVVGATCAAPSPGTLSIRDQTR